MPVYEAELLSRWSNNSGDTWSDPVPVAHWQTTGLLPEFNDEPRAAGGIPDVAIDERTGRLYVVWQDSHLTNGASNDILLASSSDEGAHWSTRTRVSNGAESFDPNVSVSRGGVVGITYFSVQRSPTDRQEQQAADYNVAFSTSEGETFDKEVRIASTKASSMPSRYWTRDYFGLAVVGKEFHPFFVMPVSGDGENLTEVFTTSMAP